MLDLEAKNEALLREELDVEEAQIQQLDPYDRLAHRRKVEARGTLARTSASTTTWSIRLKEAGSSLVSQQEIDAQKLKGSSAKAELDEAEALLKKFDQRKKSPGGRSRFNGGEPLSRRRRGGWPPASSRWKRPTGRP